VLTLLVQKHPVQKLCLSLTRWLGTLASFSLVFQWHLLTQLLPQWGVKCPQVLEISSVAHQPSSLELSFCCVDLLGACFFAWPPFSGAKSVICQPAPSCQHVVMVCWLFFNSALSFDFGCCSPSQEMSFVDCYLLYCRHQLISGLVSALLPFQPLFTEGSCGYQLLAPPPFSGALPAPHPLCCVLVFSSLFIQLYFFGSVGVSVCLGTMLVYPKSGSGNTTWGLVLTCWSAECFPSRFGAGVRRQMNLPVFSV
jgi:hypothetical protein